MDLELNYLPRLICHKTNQPTNQTKNTNINFSFMKKECVWKFTGQNCINLKLKMLESFSWDLVPVCKQLVFCWQKLVQIKIVCPTHSRSIQWDWHMRNLVARAAQKVYLMVPDTIYTVWQVDWKKCHRHQTRFFSMKMSSRPVSKVMIPIAEKLLASTWYAV